MLNKLLVVMVQCARYRIDDEMKHTIRNRNHNNKEHPRAELGGRDKITGQNRKKQKQKQKQKAKRGKGSERTKNYKNVVAVAKLLRRRHKMGRPEYQLSLV